MCTHLAQATIRGERSIGSGEIEPNFLNQRVFNSKENFCHFHYVSIPLEFAVLG